MYASDPGSMARQLDYLEDWLVTLVQQAKRTNDLLERQGKPGTGADAREESRVEKLGKRIETALASQLSYRLNQAQAISNRGFSGTVEAARMDYAMEQLGRQFAAVMKPVMDALTYGAVQIEARMRRMSGTDQNSLLGMGLGAFAGRMVGGFPGMIAGGLMGGAMGGEPSSGSAARFSLGAAVAGGHFLGPYGAIPGLAGAGYFGLRSMEESTSSAVGRDAIGALRRATPLGAIGDAVLGGPSPYSRAAAAAAGGGMGGSPRRDVTPYQADMMDAGGTYFAIQKAMIRATAGADFEESGPLKPIIDWMIKIFDMLARLAGVEFVDPRSATEARAGGGALAGAMSVRRP